MKTIKCPTEEQHPDFKGQLKVIVGAAPDSGYTIEDVRLGMKILDRIEASKDALELEDAEYNWLRGRISNTKWARLGPDIVHFVEAIEGAS